MNQNLAIHQVVLTCFSKIELKFLSVCKVKFQPRRIGFIIKTTTSSLKIKSDIYFGNLFFPLKNGEGGGGGVGGVGANHIGRKSVDIYF